MNEAAPNPRRIPHPLWLLLGGLVIVLSAGTLAIGVRHHRLETVSGRIQELGGQAVIVPGGPLWARRWLGDDQLWMFRTLKRVDLSDTPATDADLDRLAAYGTLQSLYLLGQTNVTAAGVERLQSERPGLLILRRGQAFLGIGGTVESRGFQVQFVNTDSAAERAGLQVGDVVQHFDGKPVADIDSLIRLVTSRAPGEVVRIDFLRAGAAHSVDATLGSWE